MRRVVLHIEGGRNKTEDVDMRRAFHTFFEELYELGRQYDVAVRFKLHGARQRVYDKFCEAMDNDQDSYPVLLVDSEDPVTQTGACWEHVKQRRNDNWDRPTRAQDDQCQLMVQAVESWLFADPEHLAAYYGQGFQRSSLPNRNNVEDVPKDSHIRALEAASRRTQKGRYHKYKHLPDLLLLIDPQKVKDRAPHCKRIFETLGSRIERRDWL